MRGTVFDTALYVMLAIFIISIMWIIGIYIIGGAIYPIMTRETLLPEENASTGITRNTYMDLA
ncbi:hypothetical protein DRN63_04555, partial [Nanoarchaeota archaeon]